MICGRVLNMLFQKEKFF